MSILSWIIAVTIAIVAWKFLKGMLKLIFFLAAVVIIAWQLYPYVAGLIRGLL